MRGTQSLRVQLRNPRRYFHVFNFHHRPQTTKAESGGYEQTRSMGHLFNTNHRSKGFIILPKIFLQGWREEGGSYEAIFFGCSGKVGSLILSDLLLRFTLVFFILAGIPGLTNWVVAMVTGYEHLATT